MWQAVTDAVGPEARDALWSHPDVVPTTDDIDNPEALVARLLAGAPEPDEMDLALEDFFRTEEAGPTSPPQAGSPKSDSEGQQGDRDPDGPPLV